MEVHIKLVKETNLNREYMYIICHVISDYNK
jgi:hypothetical protein